MIYIYQILKQIRLDNQYNANAIAKLLDISVKDFSRYESDFRPIPRPVLTLWLDSLDIPKQDHKWYIQKHAREYVYEQLKILPLDVPDQLLTKIADVLVFNKTIDISNIVAYLDKHTLPLVLYKPRSADIASDRIKDNDK
jgi:transcriptional regulator with XRE-family HTH domain